MNQPGASRTPAWIRPAPAVFLLAWGGNHFTPLLRLYEQLGHYSAWQANLLLGTYVAGLIPGLLLASAFSDRHGRRSVMLFGAIGSIAGSVLLAAGLEHYALLLAGRALAGLGVGVAMSVGTSWIKELSTAPFDRASLAAGARRPSLTLTLGFGIGAGITGSLAQWATAPTVLPFVVHALLTLCAIVGILITPETLSKSSRTTAPIFRDLRIPSAGHRTFTRMLLPAAPWVFAAAGVAYAIMPAVVTASLGSATTIYATALTVLTLGTGALVQLAVPSLERRTNGGALVVGLSFMFGGLLLSALGAAMRDPVFVFLVAVVLGAAYGICVVAGLLRVQAIATPSDLAGLTGLYYALTYVGFLLPTVLALTLPVVPYSESLIIVALACLGSLAVVIRATRRRRFAR